MLTLTDIQQAQTRIKHAIVRTPLLPGPQAGLYLKPENFQPMGAFKLRGAYNAIAALNAEERARGVARALVRYAFTEAGILAYKCADPRLSDDLHLFTDCYGLIQQPSPVGASGLEVDGFLWTSLLDSTPKILLNVESGDHGTLEERECGCLLGRSGLRWHVSQIRSHEKLSGEGMTFVKTNLLRALEEVLPARFGGSSADYQVLEEEAADGILRLYLLVSPSVGVVDEAAVRATFLQELSEDGALERYMVRMWDRADTVQIRREAPLATRAGKILPFHLVKSPAS